MEPLLTTIVVEEEEASAWTRNGRVGLRGIEVIRCTTGEVLISAIGKRTTIDKSGFHYLQPETVRKLIEALQKACPEQVRHE